MEEVRSASPGSYQLPVVLYLVEGRHEISPFHVKMSIDTGIVPILFMKPFLGEIAAQQTSSPSSHRVP